MKILITGHGKMGKMLENICLEKKISIQIANSSDELKKYINECDVAIDFTTADAFLKNLDLYIFAKKPLVIGTTGWHEKIEEVKDKITSNDMSAVFGTNFSIGAHVTFLLNKYLAAIMANFVKEHQFGIRLTETHHTAKLDAPSGTALTILDGIKEKMLESITPQFIKSNETISKDIHQFLVQSIRKGNVAGIHEVEYFNDTESIFIKHEAYNRNGFAMGAILAAHWIINKKGFYTAEQFVIDYLKLNQTSK